MTREAAIDYFTDLIGRDHFHRDYERSIEIAEQAYAYMTGLDQEGMVRSLRRRESEEQARQRLRLYQPATVLAGRMIERMYEKMRRVEPVDRSIAYDPEQPDKVEQLEDTLLAFHADQPLAEFLFDRLQFRTFYDPNAFLILERRNIFDASDNLQRVEVYPVEASSAEVRDYAYEQGKLKHLLVQRDDHFYLYAPGWTLHAVAMDEEDERIFTTPGPRGLVYGTLRVALDNERDKDFQYHIYDTGTDRVPAMRFITYLDPVTEHRLGVTPLEPAKYILRDLVNIKSLADLTLYLHTFPKRWEYATACDYTYGDVCCDGGYVYNHETAVREQCPGCGGTGVKRHASEQDIMQVVVPPGLNDVPDLQRFAYSEPVDESLPRFQNELIDRAYKLIMMAVFNQEVYTHAQVQTATEVLLDYTNVYDALQPYAERYSLLFRKVVEITASYQGIAEDLYVSHAFPTNLQFETQSDLLQRYKMAREIGLAPDALNNIEEQILRRQFFDPEDVRRAMVWASLRPWRNIPEALLASVIMARRPDDPMRVLWENFDRIKQDIQRDTHGRFYRFPYPEQLAILYDKVAELSSTIRYATPALDPLNIEIGV